MKFWLRGGLKGDDLEKPRRLLFLRYSVSNQEGGEVLEQSLLYSAEF